jgi:type VI protein secretion system component VasF
MKNMPSPAKAERNQRRKLQYFPPVWPLLAVIVLVVVIVFLVSHH